MIRKPYEVREHRNRRGLVYGTPGIAKSTTSLSAPKPLVIDFDHGWHRIPPQLRTADYIQPEDFSEVLNDLKDPETLKAYETIVIDTGGAMLTMMKEWAIKRDPKFAQKDGQTLSLKGYGFIGQQFEKFVNHIYYTLKKNVLLIFHAREESDGDQKVYRLDVEGQTRNNIWKVMDFGGFMEAVGEQRIISFAPTDRFYAKGTQGIFGQHKIPNVMKGAPNNFLTELFNSMKNEDAKEAELTQKYQILMKEWKEVIEKTNTPDEINIVLEKMKDVEHVYTSKIELWHEMKDHAEKMGWKFSGERFEEVANA